jgi:hypothetical protein
MASPTILVVDAERLTPTPTPLTRVLKAGGYEVLSARGRHSGAGSWAVGSTPV